jgi:saccharopine dehydrogenase (NAD+, L-lysine-forming)
MTKNIFIRKEIYPNEYRTPIVPKDILLLVKNNYNVFVESSTFRCYSDEEYHKNGAIIVYDDWINYKYCLIIGIKELDKLEFLNNHTHIYFSHSYKNQTNSKYILQKFKESNSILYDLEYFIINNKRILAFGFYAGIVGSALGLIQYFSKLEKLSYWKSLDDLINYTFTKCGELYNIKIAIIGNGRCSKGVQYLLNLQKILFTLFEKKNTKNNLEQYDIVLNCINLNENIGTWFDNTTIFYKKIVIVDISCDYNSKFNPIKIYNEKTSWENPVIYYNEFVSIIAIDNLPSLIPLESSNEFSEKMIYILENENQNFWINNYNKYCKMIDIY